MKRNNFALCCSCSEGKSPSLLRTAGAKLEFPAASGKMMILPMICDLFHTLHAYCFVIIA